METWDAITSRRNVRQYRDEAIPTEHLDQILEAGRLTPSARNRQPWDFVVVTDREQLARLADVWQGAGHVPGSAATIALVTPEPEDARQSNLFQYDLGQATMAMILVATDLGIGTGHSSAADQDLAREILGFPPDHRLAYMLAIGYPADRSLAPIKRHNRRPFDEVVHRGRW